MEEYIWARKKKNSQVPVGGAHPENRLQQARIKAGVTQAQAAEKLGMDTRSFQAYEYGITMPKLDKLIILREFYDCEAADFFPLVDGKNKWIAKLKGRQYLLIRSYS